MNTVERFAMKLNYPNMHTFSSGTDGLLDNNAVYIVGVFIQAILTSLTVWTGF